MIRRTDCWIPLFPTRRVTWLVISEKWWSVQCEAWYAELTDGPPEGGRTEAGEAPAGETISGGQTGAAIEARAGHAGGEDSLLRRTGRRGDDQEETAQDEDRLGHDWWLILLIITVKQ